MKSNIRCDYCNSTTHPTSDCPVKFKQRALNDPKSALAITDNVVDQTPEEQLHTFLQEIKHGQTAKEQLQGITYESIKQNAGKSYEDQQDIGNIVREHNEIIQEGTQALVLVEKTLEQRMAE